MTDVPLIYLVGAIVIKKAVFEKLPPAHQQVLLELCPKYMGQLKLVIRKENQEAIKVMEKHGVKLIHPSAEQIEGFKEISQKAMQHQIGKSFSKEVRDRVTAYLEAHRKSAQ